MERTHIRSICVHGGGGGDANRIGGGRLVLSADFPWFSVLSLLSVSCNQIHFVEKKTYMESCMTHINQMRQQEQAKYIHGVEAFARISHGPTHKHNKQNKNQLNTTEKSNEMNECTEWANVNDPMLETFERAYHRAGQIHMVKEQEIQNSFRPSRHLALRTPEQNYIFAWMNGTCAVDRKKDRGRQQQKRRCVGILDFGTQ